jgi:hypothetical protein
LALGEGFFKKNKGGFPECLSMGTRGRGFEKRKMNFFPECCTRGRGFKIKKKEISSPSVALGEE